MNSKNILLVSSPGGHFIELGLVAEMLESRNLTIVSTYEQQPSSVDCSCYYKVSDFNRDNFLKGIVVLSQCFRIILKEKPKLVISTGAAPALVMLLVSRFFRIKCIWIDSIANTKKLSLSAKIAKLINCEVISQWKSIADSEKVGYEGRLI